MPRDRRLLGAIVAFAASALGAAVQGIVIQGYILTAVIGDWQGYARMHGVRAPAENCMDYCVADLPFGFGWMSISFFLVGFGLLCWCWRKPFRSQAM